MLLSKLVLRNAQNPKSMLDELQSGCDTLAWTIGKRRQCGLLGPSIIAEDDNSSLPVDFDSAEPDEISLLFDEMLEVIDFKRKALPTYLANYAFADSVGHVGHTIWHKVLLYLGFQRNTKSTSPFPSEESSFSDEPEPEYLKIRRNIYELKDLITAVTQRRELYCNSYQCAFYARFPVFIDKDPIAEAALQHLRNKSKAEQRKIYHGYSLQTVYQQSQVLYIFSKKIVTMLERMQKLKADPSGEICIPEEIGCLVPSVANMFERSLLQCSKFPHTVIAASGLSYFAALSVQRVSQIVSELPNDLRSVEGDQELHSWRQHWMNSLKGLDDFYDSYVASYKARLNSGSIHRVATQERLLHHRAGIFRCNNDATDSKTLCEREGISFATIGSKITQAYHGKIIFDKAPEKGQSTILGSYGKVYKTELLAPKSYTVEVDTYRKEKTRSFRCEKVAVKKIRLPPDLSEERACVRIIRELETWIVLRHESILPLIGLWSNYDNNFPNYPLLVSPWMDDGDIHHYIVHRPETSLREKLVFLHDIASALAYMHGHHDVEFVHGDLKGDNVLVKDGRAYLHDFGISRILDGGENLGTKKPSGNWRWQAPELIDLHRGKPASDIPVTPHSDMYAYGSLFLEVLTGKYPWEGPSSFEYRIHHRSKIQRRPESLHDDQHWKLMRHCWMEEPTLRLTAVDALLKVRSFLSRDQTIDGPDFKSNPLY